MTKQLTLKQRRRVATAYAKAHFAGKPYRINAGVCFEDGTFRKMFDLPTAALIGQGYNFNQRMAIVYGARHERTMK